jgi:hypothetical protein
LEENKNNDDDDDNNKSKEVTVSIKDTGIGIAPEIVPRLYKICYKIRERNWLRFVHIKKYYRISWWQDMGRE